VWDAATGQELLTLNGHADSVWAVAVSPDGRRIITGSDDNTAKVWDAATGQELLTLNGHADSVSAVAVSPDGRRIITGSDDKTAKVWDAATGQELLTLNGHASSVSAVAVSPDGRRIITGSDDKTAKVWEARTGAEIAVQESPPASRNGPLRQAPDAPLPGFSRPAWRAAALPSFDSWQSWPGGTDGEALACRLRLAQCARAGKLSRHGRL
jgi:WD40 repeat protein